MDTRYRHPTVASLLAPAHRLSTWTKIERVVAQEQAALGLIPAADGRNIASAHEPAQARVDELEAETRHDVEAFVRALIETSGSQFVHHGMTSSDLVDTANAVVYSESALAVVSGIHRLWRALGHHANAHANTLRVGRTHGRWADPTTLGHQMEVLAERARRACAQINRAEIPMKLSGPVGAYAYNPPELEQRVAHRLGLTVTPAAGQVVSRDYYADYAYAMVQAAAACEQVAMFVRTGATAEVDEIREAFGAGQAGSSSMPNKRNPVRSERICGLARVARGYLIPILETESALWGERDISNSSVERVALPELVNLAAWLACETADLVTGLEFDTGKMADLVDIAGLPTAAGQLYAAVQDGWDRNTAYQQIRDGWELNTLNKLASDDPAWYVRGVARQSSTEV